MKCIQDDGTNIYKLTDFGVARELTDDETFQTICGTKQYLHPDIYERAILCRPNDKKFNSSVDLWSIGVTLYHIATGTLPFVAYRGHGNKETLHYITTKKESGIISGVQTKENGPINWSRELPEICLLSNELKKFITPIIAGLLETNPSKVWGFDAFFRNVEVLLSCVIVNIFYVNKAKLIKIYMLPDQKYEDLQQCVTGQTKIESANQILLYKSKSLKSIIQEVTRLSEYPKTSEDYPLFLFNREYEEFLVMPVQIPEWTDFPVNISTEKDATPAKCACIIGHHCDREIEKYSLCCKLIRDSIEALIDYIDRDIKYMQLRAQNLFEKIGIYEKTAKMLQLSLKISNIKCEGNFGSKLKNINEQFVTVTELVANLYNAQCFENNIKSNWDSIIRDLKCPVEALAPIRGKTQVAQLRKSWQYFTNEPTISNMSYSKSQWYVLERKKVRQSLRNIIFLLEKETFSRYQQMAKCFEDWYISVDNIYFKINVLQSEIEQYEKKLKDFENELTVDYYNYIENKDQLSKNHANTENVEKRKQFQARLENYLKDTDTFNEIILENTRLMNQIQDFTKRLKP